MFDRELVHSVMVQVSQWLMKIKKRSGGLLKKLRIAS